MWFKVCDGLHDHRKVRRAGTAAIGLWALAGSWSAANLTDGFVPEVVVLRYGTARQAERLVTAGLWEPTVRDGEPGWVFHDWFTYQPTRKEVERKRVLAAQRQAKARAVRDSKGRSAGSVTRDNGVTHTASHASPDPTRPDIPTHLDSAGGSSVSRASAETPPPTPDPVDVPQQPTPGKSTVDALRSAVDVPAVRVAVGLVGEHVPHQPRKVLHRLTQEAARLLGEGLTGDQVAAGLRLWTTKRVGPGLLPELVGEAMRAPTITAANSGQGGVRTASTTDARVSAALALAERYEREDNPPQPEPRPVRALVAAGVA